MFGQLVDFYNDWNAFRKAGTDGRLARLDNLDALVSAMQTSATALAQYNALLAAMPPNVALRRAWFTAAGTFTFVAPVEDLIIYATAGGGGYSQNSNWSSIGIGGGGAAIVGLPVKVTLGQQITFTVGAAGVNNVSSNPNSPVNATNGGNTTILGIALPGGNGGTANLVSSNIHLALGGSVINASANSKFLFNGSAAFSSAAPGMSGLHGISINGNSNLGRGATQILAAVAGCVGFEWIGKAS